MLCICFGNQFIDEKRDSDLSSGMQVWSTAVSIGVSMCRKRGFQQYPARGLRVGMRARIWP